MTATPPTAGDAVQVGDLGAAYVARATGDARERRRAVKQFRARFDTIEQWRNTPPADQLAASPAARAFAAFAAVGAWVAVDATYVVGAASKWGRHVADRDPEQAARFRLQASSLGFDRLEVDKMWSKLAQISVIAGTTPEALTRAVSVGARSIPNGRDREARTGAEVADHTAVRARCSDVPPRPSTPPCPAGSVAGPVSARDWLGPDR